MTETERMQQLHHAAATGCALTVKEKAALESWYETLDRDEAIINRRIRPVKIEALREKVEKTTAQIVVVGEDIAASLKQNDLLRRENAALRRQLEARFTEQAT